MRNEKSQVFQTRIDFRGRAREQQHDAGKGQGKQTEEMPIDESEEDGSEEEVSHTYTLLHCDPCR